MLWSVLLAVCLIAPVPRLVEVGSVVESRTVVEITTRSGIQYCRMAGDRPGLWAMSHSVRATIDDPELFFVIYVDFGTDQ